MRTLSLLYFLTFTDVCFIWIKAQAIDSLVSQKKKKKKKNLSLWVWINYIILIIYFCHYYSMWDIIYRDTPNPTIYWCVQLWIVDIFFLLLFARTHNFWLIIRSQEKLRGCLVYDFKQPFLVFKQHFTHFNTLFHPHVFPQIFSNNNFQFLNTCTKRTLNSLKKLLTNKVVWEIVLFGKKIPTGIFFRGNHKKQAWKLPFKPQDSLLYFIF